MIENFLKELYPHLTPKEFDGSYHHCQWYAESQRNPNYHVGQREYPVGDNESLPETFPLCEVGKKLSKIATKKKKNIKETKVKARIKKGKMKKKNKKSVKCKNPRERKLMEFCKKAYGIGECTHYLERRAGEHRWDAKRKKKHDIVFLDDENLNFRSKKKRVPDRISMHDRGESEYITGSVIETEVDRGGTIRRRRRVKRNPEVEKLDRKRDEHRWMFERGIHDTAYGMFNTGLANSELNKRRSTLYKGSRRVNDILNKERSGHDHYSQSTKENTYTDFLRG